MASQRKKLFVDPKFQKWFILYSLVVAVVVCVIFSGGFHFFLGSMEAIILSADELRNEGLLEYLDEQRVYLWSTFLLSSLISFSLVIVLSLFYSHRIAGPIVRMKAELESWLNSETSNETIKFRRSDFFVDLGEAVSAFRAKLSKNRTS